MPKLSIITINLNNAAGLEKTLNSVITQTYRDFEYLVIDGDSGDGSAGLIKKNSDHINYSVSEPDTGIYSAMNKGILKASGEYVLFLNSGDWLINKDVLAKVFKQNFSEDLVYGIQVMDKNNVLQRTPAIRPEFITLGTFIKTSLPHQCTLIKRSLFSDIGLYNEKNKIVSDWEFNLKALFIKNCTIKNIEVEMTVFDFNGVSNNPSVKELHQQERERSLHTLFPRIMPDYKDFEALQDKRYFKVYRWLKHIKNNMFKS